MYYIKNRTFPTELKKTRVTLTYKNKGSQMEYGNYRSISRIAHIAKALEKVIQIHQELKGYLFDHRSQTVRIWCVSSDELRITTGVLRGSVLGPLLFLVYMNDIPTCLPHTTGNQFADDKIPYGRCGTTIDVQESMQEDVHENINAWLILNKLTFNISKSGTMLVWKAPKFQLALKAN